MKTKTITIKILFLILSASFFFSCELTEELEDIKNIQQDKWDVKAIGREEVEDPADRGDKD